MSAALRRAAPAHSLTDPVQSFSHFRGVISRFSMSIQIKRRRKSTKAQTARFLTLPKYVGGKKQTLKPGPFVEVKWCSEILHRATANVRVWRATRSCETNSAERFKGRRFIPTGISSCLLPLTGLRSFIEISAHHTGCNKRRLLYQNHNNCTGGKKGRTEIAL